MTFILVNRSPQTVRRRGVHTVAPIATTDAPTLRVVDASGRPPVAEVAPRPRMHRVVGNALGAFVVTLLLTLSAFAVLPKVIGYDSVIVSSGSMVPTLRRSDVVVLAPVDDVRVRAGSVVNVERPTGPVIHRVVAVAPDGYTTKGDANQSVDGVVSARRDVTGVGVFLVPFVGQPALWFDEGAWLPLAALAATVVAGAYVGRRRWLT